MRPTTTLLLLAICLAGQPSPAPAVGNDRQSWRDRAINTASSDFTQDDVSEEVIFGREIAARILGRHKLADNAKLQKYVNLVGNAIAWNTRRTELEFHFAVIESNEINAYSTPGGYVFVTTAALRQMDNEAELAGVLAHEIGHVVERHIVNELHLRAADTSVASSLAALIGGSTESASVAFSQAVDSAVDILFRDGYKKEYEMQADKDAVYFCALAGYNPTGLVTLLERVGRIKTGVGKSYPLYDVRLSVLQRVIGEEGLADSKLATAPERFANVVKK